MMVVSPEALAAKLERQLAFKQFNEKMLLKAQARKAAITAEQLAHEKFVADHTPLGAVNITNQPGKLFFRNVELGELEPQESVWMLGAYNNVGQQVGRIEYKKDGKPITIANLEESLNGPGIVRIIIAIRGPADNGQTKRVRIVDYNLLSGIISHHTK